MNPKAPSFTAYDFLGYAVPGLAAIALIDASIYYHISGIHIDYDSVFNRYLSLSFQSIVPVVLFAYLVGHILSFFSSILIEKHSTWMHGIPTNFLLNHGSPAKYFDVSGKAPWASAPLRFITAVLVAPISLPDFLFTKVIPLSGNYIRPMDSILVDACASAHSSILIKSGIDVDEHSEEQFNSFDLHRLTIHCALESAPAHVSSMRNYVVLYGFLRSVSLLSVASFWGLLFHLFGVYSWCFIVTSGVISSLLAFSCYAAYLKFRVRYHKEGLMALVASHVKSQG